MGINFFLKNINLKKAREQYVDECRVEDVRIEPCGKFVACIEKLSRNYVLALKDMSSTEILQVASQNDIEFYEGYELAPAYTDDLRKKICVILRNVYDKIVNIAKLLSDIEWRGVENKNILNDIKLNFNVISSVVENIFKHIAMTNELPVQMVNNTLKLKELMFSALEDIIELKSKINIEYIVKQLDIIIDKIILYYESIKNNRQ